MMVPGLAWGGPGKVRPRRPVERLFNGSAPARLGTTSRDGPEIPGLQGGATDQRAVNVCYAQDLRGIAGLDRPAIEQPQALPVADAVARQGSQLRMHVRDLRGRRHLAR